MFKHNFRWFIVFLIAIITLVNYIDRSAISFVIEILKQEYNISETEFGLILSAFGIGYLIFSPFSGQIVDKLGPKKVWSQASVIWSIIFGSISLATGFFGFFIMRLMLGMAESVHFPALNKTINLWLNEKQRGKALGLGLMAVPLASVIGAPLCTTLIETFGWKGMFISISALGILWAFAWVYFFKDNPKFSEFVSFKEKQQIGIEKSSKNKKGLSSKKIWLEPTLIANNIAYFSLGYMLFFGTLWLPGYFLKSFDLDLKSVGWYLTIPWLSSAFFLYMGGHISDFIYKKTKSLRFSRSYIILGSQALAAMCFLILAFSSSLETVLVFLSLALGFGMMANACFYNINIDIAKERSGTAQGISSVWFSIAGILSPALTGWVVDKSGSFKSAFVLVVIITGISVLTTILFHKPDKERI